MEFGLCQEVCALRELNLLPGRPKRLKSMANRRIAMPHRACESAPSSFAGTRRYAELLSLTRLPRRLPAIEKARDKSRHVLQYRLRQHLRRRWLQSSLRVRGLR